MAYDQASIQTAEDLKAIASRTDVSSLSQLSLPEIETISALVGNLVPAGNVPAVILSGLARLPGRKIPVEMVRRDIRLLFKGVEQTLDRALFTTLFAGPAAILWGYQNLLKLAGKSQESAFPDGPWQFYSEYALREDAARHTNETHGFDTTLRQHNIQLSVGDRITAWVMAAIHTLHQYDALLENEWRERVAIALLEEVTQGRPDSTEYQALHQQWMKQIPYARTQDARHRNYPTYRRWMFDQFLQPHIDRLPSALQLQWYQSVQEAENQELPAYQRQMSILAYLQPDIYNETRVQIAIEEACVAIYHKGCYFLLPACMPGTKKIVDVMQVRNQVAKLLRVHTNHPPACLAQIARVKRATQPELRQSLSVELRQDLEKLQDAPILINTGPIQSNQPLAKLRQTERGIGDHALTILDTGSTFVFDQSHIFFDGAWGAACAEIMTNEALSWAVYLHATPMATCETSPAVHLRLNFQKSDLQSIQSVPKLVLEASAENDTLDLQAINNLRHLLRKRNPDLHFTVNDLLVLYRAIHAAAYQPDAALLQELHGMLNKSATQAAADATLQAITSLQSTNPSLLIPVATNNRYPRNRVIPLSFDVPLNELNLLSLHKETLQALDVYKAASGDRSAQYESFHELQRAYLATLAGFGAIMRKAKLIALRGESASISVLKLLAHLPAPLQRVLDKIPGNFDLLNDIIKGREVFSNIGAVAATSTLKRFISAKDDNDKKTLIWGIMTDNQNTTHISLRDFRPHIEMLINVDKKDIAFWITRDYLDSYVAGLNRYIADLRHITITSRPSHARLE